MSEETRTLLDASTDEDGNLHLGFGGWLSIWDEIEGRVYFNGPTRYLVGLVSGENPGDLPLIRGGPGREAYDPWYGYEDGELFAQGPCGRYTVRAFGPTDDPEEADAGGEVMVSFSAAETEPAQQTLEGFAVYKRTRDGGIRWIADSLTLGRALDVAKEMAESGRAPSPYNGADRADLSPTDRAMVETMDALDAEDDDPAAPMAFQPAPGTCSECGGEHDELDADGWCPPCQRAYALRQALDALIQAVAQSGAAGMLTGHSAVTLRRVLGSCRQLLRNIE